MKTLITWFAGFFDESKPQSFSRGITFVIVAFILGWDTATVRWTHHTIDGATLIAQLTGGAIFYAARRAVGAYTDVKLGANQPENKDGGSAS